MQVGLLQDLELDVLQSKIENNKEEERNTSREGEKKEGKNLPHS